MADSREPFSFNEMFLTFARPDGGGAGGQMGWAENVRLDVEETVQKFLYLPTGTDYGSRSQFVSTDYNVRMTIGKLFAGASSFYQSMNSGVNLSAFIGFTGNADGYAAEFVLYSARMVNYGLQADNFGIVRENITVIAPDISGF